MKRFFLYSVLALGFTNISLAGSKSTNNLLAAGNSTNNAAELQWAICNQNPNEVVSALSKSKSKMQTNATQQVELTYLDTEDFLLFKNDVQIKIEFDSDEYKITVKVNNQNKSTKQSKAILAKKPKCEWDVYPGTDGSEKYSCKINNIVETLEGNNFSADQINFVKSETGLDISTLDLKHWGWMPYEEMSTTIKSKVVTGPLTIDSVKLDNGTPITEISYRTTLDAKVSVANEMNKKLKDANISLCPTQQGKFSRIISE